MSAVCVLSYNVLSPPLARPEHFVLCRPEDLHPDVRLQRVMAKIEMGIEIGAVIALQEVCLAWSGPLHAFFCQRGYHFLSSLYDTAGSDWMGVGLAWPTALYQCESAEACRLADTKPTPWPVDVANPLQNGFGETRGKLIEGKAEELEVPLEAPPEVLVAPIEVPLEKGCWAGFRRLCSSLSAGSRSEAERNLKDADGCSEDLAGKKEEAFVPVVPVSNGNHHNCSIAPAETLFDPWVEAERRNNRIVLACLRPYDGSPPFCVASYHMPALYGSAEKIQALNIHTSLLSRKMSLFADGLPSVLLGDFNFQPGSSPYRLLTHGSLARDDEELPPLREGDEWTASPVMQRFRSAYQEALGTEPVFTNYAVKAGPDGNPEPAFCGTLDYIFVSDDWHVRQVWPVPPRSQFSGPLPDASEPSDHLLVGATLWPTAGGIINWSSISGADGGWS